MADEQRPAKPVVKRVVKKATAAPRSETAKPKVRYGRPVDRTPAPVAKAAPKPPKRTVTDTVVIDQDVETTTEIALDADPVESAPQAKKPKRGANLRRPSLPKPALPKPSLPKPSLKIGNPKERVGSIGSGFVAVFRKIIAVITDAFWYVVDTVRMWRLPRIDAVPASLITGVVVGLLAVGLGVGALHLFTWLRGVASGGGTWGSLTFVVVGFVAFLVGELLLQGFGVANPRLTSFLGVAITVVLILAVFLEESDTRMAFLVVPAVAATAYTIGHWLMAAAEAGAAAED